MDNRRSNLAVGKNRIVSIRYSMMNSAGDLLVDTLNERPVEFLFGAGGILPGLELPLKGLRTGDVKCFTLNGDDVPQLEGTFHFKVVVEDVRWAADAAVKAQGSSIQDCGPDCKC